MDGLASTSRNDLYARPRFTFAANVFSFILASAGSVLRAVLLAVSAIARIRCGMRRRREAQILARLNPRMLADIGLTPGEVRDAFSQPLWRLGGRDCGLD